MISAVKTLKGIAAAAALSTTFGLTVATADDGPDSCISFASPGNFVVRDFFLGPCDGGLYLGGDRSFSGPTRPLPDTPMGSGGAGGLTIWSQSLSVAEFEAIFSILAGQYFSSYRNPEFEPHSLFATPGVLSFSGFDVLLGGLTTTFGDQLSILNEGLWDMQSDHGVASGFVDYRARFENRSTGIFRKSGGNGITLVSNIDFHDAGGTIDAQTGTIQFSGSGDIEFSATSFVGEGTVKLSTDASFTSVNEDSTSLEFAAGTFSPSNVDATLRGSSRWTGGTFQGTWRNEGTLIVVPGTDDDGSASTKISGTFINSISSTRLGLVLVEEDGLILSVAPGGTASFNNFQGVFRKSGGTGSTIIGDVDFGGGGTVEALTGVIDFAGGKTSFSGTKFLGPGIVRISNDAEFSSIHRDSTSLEFAAGTFSPSGGSATLRGSSRWTGGTFQGLWRNEGTLIVVPGTDDDGSASTKISGTFINSTSSTSLGLVLVEEDGLVLSTAPGETASFNNNLGVFRKSGGTGSTIIGDVEFGGAGIVEALTGVIDFAGGKTSFGGTKFLGPGIVRISNDAELSSIHEDSTSLEFAAGTFSPSGGSATLRGSSRWTGGTFQGLWRNEGTLIVVPGTDDDGSASTKISGTFINSTSSTRLGLVLVEEDGLILSAAPGGTASFNNNLGVFRKSGGTGSTIIGDVEFGGAGIVEALTGVIDFAGGKTSFGGTKFLGPGVVRISNDAELSSIHEDSTSLEFAAGTFSPSGGSATLRGSSRWTGGTFQGVWGNEGNLQVVDGLGITALGPTTTFTNYGTLFGAGSIVMNGARFVNRGVIAPGNSPGTLEFTGDLDLTATSVLRLEIGGDFTSDKVVVGGKLSLSGKLVLERVAQSSLTLNDSLALLMFDEIEGTAFDSIELLGFGPSERVDVIYSSNSISLRTSAVPIPSAMILFASGLLGLVFGKRRLIP